VVGATIGSYVYPLQLEPAYQSRPSGGRRLNNLLSAPLPGGGGPVGEARLLCDRDDRPT
jgi:mannose-6-phosphate isomerase